MWLSVIGLRSIRKGQSSEGQVRNDPMCFSRLVWNCPLPDQALDLSKVGWKVGWNKLLSYGGQSGQCQCPLSEKLAYVVAIRLVSDLP